MKFRSIVLFLFCAISLTVMAQEKSKRPKPEHFYGTSFITEDEPKMPDAYYYLPAPPKESEGRFLTDSVMYEEGKKLRLTSRGDTAIADANTRIDYILQRFSPAVGITLTKADYPKVTTLLEGVLQDSRSSISKAKKTFARHRPYQHFGEGTPVPQEESPTDFTSYPSGHTIRAWAAALTLSTLFPERANEIMKVGYEMGQSRVILGYHYQSDVDAARMAASAAMARLWADKDFRKAMKQARKEINK